MRFPGPKIDQVGVSVLGRAKVLAGLLLGRANGLLDGGGDKEAGIETSALVDDLAEVW